MKIGLYFGTFNPIHVGHLIIANYMAQYTDLDRVWMVVTPQNPLKKNHNLLEDYHRLALVRIAVEDNHALDVTDIEFKLPKPSYTVNTLAALGEKYPNYSFNLIMGEDNLRTLHKWRNHEHLIQNHHLYVYPRTLTEEEQAEINKDKQTSNQLFSHPNVKIVHAPVLRISSSLIRQAIKDKKDVRYLLTPAVHQYCVEMNFYKK